MKRHIYREGDLVEIVNPRWIKRVGYPLHWKDLVDQVEQVPGYAQAVQALGYRLEQASSLLASDYVPFYLRQAIAKVHVERNSFGGNERTIHYYPLDDGSTGLAALFSSGTMPAHGYVGRIALVEGKRMAHTGIRFPSSSGKDQDTPNGPGEYWEESGGLNNRKSHLILRTTFGEIEACDVRLVKAASKKGGAA